MSRRDTKREAWHSGQERAARRKSTIATRDQFIYKVALI
jgi:hypothetical protein